MDIESCADYVKQTVDAFERILCSDRPANARAALVIRHTARLPLALLSVESDRPVARHSSSLQASSVCYITCGN